MVRVQMRPAVGALAAALAMELAGYASSAKADSRMPPPPPPTLTHAGTDILGGVGKFDAPTDPRAWFLQAPDRASLEIDECPGFTRNCARIAGDLGANDYDAQLINWDSANDAPRYVTLSKAKKYTIALLARASTAGATIKVALVDDTYVEVGSSTFTLTTAPAAYIGDPIQLTSGNGRDVALRVDVGGTANAGVRFRLDDIQVFEEDAPLPPPTGTDLLAGNGSFETAGQQGSWFLNVPSVGTGDPNASLTFPACADLDGSCAVVSSSNYGGDVWHTQLAYGTPGSTGGSGAPAQITLDQTKTYRIIYKGKLTSPDNGNRSFSIWLQHGSDFPPPIQLAGTLSTSAASYDSGDLTLDTTFFSGGTAAVDFVVNLGPDSANKGVTFFFDDIELLER